MGFDLDLGEVLPSMLDPDEAAAAGHYCSLVAEEHVSGGVGVGMWG